MNDLQQLQVNIGAPDTALGRGKRQDPSWFEKMASAWGKALDDQAGRIIDRAEALDDGQESPSDVTMLTAEALRLQFLSNSSHTALTSMGSALETMARKQ